MGTINVVRTNSLQKTTVNQTNQSQPSPGSPQLTEQDVSLMKEFFGLSCRYEDMSPVLIPAGYTRDYIDGKIAAGDQLKDVHTAFEAS